MGFCKVDVYPPGPDQLYEAPEPPPLAYRFSVLPEQIEPEVLDAEIGRGITTIVKVSFLVAPMLSVPLTTNV